MSWLILLGIVLIYLAANHVHHFENINALNERALLRLKLHFENNFTERLS